MPRKPKQPYASHLPADLEKLPFSDKNERLISREAWEVKNARAKAIIMSTLVPGSEAWKLAEPMEYAQDIWKALERKYGPKDGTTQMWQPGTPWVESDQVKEAAQELEQDETTRAELERRKEAVIKSLADQKAAKARTDEVDTPEVDTPGIKSQARTIEELDPPKTQTGFNAQDKRFLWALLNGGKNSLNSSAMENLELHKKVPRVSNH